MIEKVATIASRVRARRDELGLEQADLARRSGLSLAYISRLERELVPNPKIYDLERVARVLGISVWDLILKPDSESPDSLRREAAKALGPRNAEYVAGFVEQLADLDPATQDAVLKAVRGVLRGFQESEPRT